MFKRGGIYTVNLEPASDQQQNTCPCLVISNNISNEYSPVVTIIPLSFSNLTTTYEFEAMLPARNTGLERDAKISTHIIITINKSKVVGERLGFVGKGLMKKIEKALFLQLDLK
jgi:mRNA interferase MazF